MAGLQMHPHAKMKVKLNSVQTMFDVTNKRRYLEPFETQDTNIVFEHDGWVRTAKEYVLHCEVTVAMMMC